MKLQSIQTIDFSKANKQIKNLSHKFLQSKMLRKNKENCNPNTISQENAAKLLLEALRKPIIRNLRELIRIKESMVFERNMFDEVCSLGVSENSDVGEGFKISFANLSIKQESIIDFESMQQINAPILLFIVLQNIRTKKLIISFQEIKYFILQRNLTQVNQRLQYAKREQLRKILINKRKQEELLMQVYMKYWSQQTQLLIFFDHFGSKIKRIYNNKLGQYFDRMKCQIRRKEGLSRLIRFGNIKLFEYGQCLNRIYKDLHLQRCLQNVFKKQIQFSFKQIQSVTERSPIIFELLQQFQNKLQKQSIKILQLHSLRQRRKFRSFSYGFQDLEKVFKKIHWRWGFSKLQSKGERKRLMLPTKYLVLILKRVEDRQKNWVLLKLNQ
ncbi:unnamed protein product (macronuclear) [Paramecium tetraurelia]|uniref:Uncharacterized protein n=1 Tax=Paramecium tetraurelia TaxID=5888 RepID=A0C8H7_PARTE|nr:uncharacterized protein GSPATT00036227001 [Paramecium tetraurelia]CAK67094.1 unnamed protein product [Paramecium tetraurelia]|eukprot:XP_001434491.1 hypothetical protein (macronuclear) [Paramecium tetraurelia strain d4-2]